MKPLVLGLGNDLLGDDGLGISAVRAIRDDIADLADVRECGLAGLALLDILAGYKQAIIVDAVSTGKNKPGTILRILPEELKSVPCYSPHYVGLPDVIAVARHLDICFPEQIVIFAVETERPFGIGQGLSETIENSLTAVNSRIKKQLSEWAGEFSRD